MRRNPALIGTLSAAAAAAATMLSVPEAESRVTYRDCFPAVRVSAVDLRLTPPERLAQRIAATGLRAAIVPVWARGTVNYPSTIVPGGGGQTETDPNHLPKREADLRPLRQALCGRDIRFYASCPIFDGDLETSMLEGLGSECVDQYGRWWPDDRIPAKPIDRGWVPARIAQMVEMAKILRPDAIVLDAFEWPNVGMELKGDPSGWPIDHPLYDFQSGITVGTFLTSVGLGVPPYASADTVSESRWILGQHREAWNRWRCETLASFIPEAVAAVRRVAPEMKFYVTVLPYPGELNRRLAGQDLALLAPHVDGVIVKAHHERLERAKPWVKLVTTETRALCGDTPVWVELESTLTGRDVYTAAQDLDAVAHQALDGGARGLVFSDWSAFEEGRDREAGAKRKVVRGFFR